MGGVGGRVVLEETGIGIPNLVVTAYDVSQSGGTSDPEGARLGTVVTRDDGGFGLTFGQSVEAADRPDLFLVVRGPAGGARDPNGVVVYESPSVRRAAAPVEEFLITVTAKALQKAGLPVPVGSSSPAVERPASALFGAMESLQRREQLKTTLHAMAAGQVAIERNRAKAVADNFRQPLLDQLAGATAEDTGYVSVDSTPEQVRTATWDAVGRSVNKPKPPVTGYIQVAEDSIPAEFPTTPGTPVDAPAALVERYLFGKGSESFRPTERVREDPIALARDQAAKQGLLEAALNAPADDSSRTDTPQPNPPPATKLRDLPAYVHRLVDGITPPEAEPSATRPDSDAVQDSADAFSLRSGPADVPAVYDFHSLQIAFDHVWTHAIDADVIRLSEELCARLTDAGGDPVEAVKTGGVQPLRALRDEFRHVRRAQKPTVLARFDNPKDEVGDENNPGPIGVPPLPPDKEPPSWAGQLDDWKSTFDWKADNTPKQPHELLDELEELLQEPYKFEIFAPGSVNFGLNVTYRQRWVPITYQVGDLVKTITLTPKETRKIATKRVQRKERAVKELENSVHTRKDESSETGRDESEIIRKAQAKTSFSLAAEGSYNVGISKGDSKTSFNTEAADESADTKKSFREAVRKAAQEYKDERKLEVETKEFSEFETTESTEITNPNDELTVTYLFYELQRRFKISEQLHRITPVVLVGLEVPNPNRREIDRTILTHSWIINRVLLDDRYRPALTYLTSTIVGDELALRERLATVTKLRAIVDKTEANHAALVNEVKRRNAVLENIGRLRAQKVGADESAGWVESAWEGIVGEGDDESLEAARIHEENAKAAYEKVLRAEQELRESLRSETAALNNATSEYAQALAEHSNRLLEVASLRVHFKANLLYYMQAIWSHTHRDHHFFSMHKVKAPTLTARSVDYTVEQLTQPPANLAAKPGHVTFKVTVDKVFKTRNDPTDPADPAHDKTLAELAHLGEPLGFIGNLMILRLKRSNALTDFMMTLYIDAELGLHDPDELGSWTPEDFVDYVKSLRETLLPDEFDAMLEQLRKQYRRIISAPRRPEEEIVIPSDSLYIETLPGKHPNLEDFKLRHRAVDVQKVRAEVRKLELENLRYAGRVLAGERGDPETDKLIRIDGNGGVVVPSEG